MPVTFQSVSTEAASFNSFCCLFRCSPPYLHNILIIGISWFRNIRHFLVILCYINLRFSSHLTTYFPFLLPLFKNSYIKIVKLFSNAYVIMSAWLLVPTGPGRALCFRILLSFFFLSAFYFTQKFFLKKKNNTSSFLLLHLLWAYTLIFNFFDILTHCSQPSHVFPLGVPPPWRSVACCTVVIFGSSLYFSPCTPLLYFLILLVLSCRTARIGYFGVIFHIWKGLCACHILMDSLHVEFKVKKHVSFRILKKILCSSLRCCY